MEIKTPVVGKLSDYYKPGPTTPTHTRYNNIPTPCRLAMAYMVATMHVLIPNNEKDVQRKTTLGGGGGGGGW